VKISGESLGFIVAIGMAILVMIWVSDSNMPGIEIPESSRVEVVRIFAPGTDSLIMVLPFKAWKDANETYVDSSIVTVMRVDFNEFAGGDGKLTVPWSTLKSMARDTVWSDIPAGLVP